MRRIRIAYEVVTPESAADGDCADRGWEEEEGICIEPDGYDAEEHGSESAAAVALAVKTIGRGCEPSDAPTCCPGHTWYTQYDADHDYTDGSDTSYSYFLDGFSEAEELAIYAELCGK